jgi:hypothetical protein
MPGPSAAGGGKSMTPSGIDSAKFRPTVLCLNQLRHRLPRDNIILITHLTTCYTQLFPLTYFIVD